MNKARTDPIRKSKNAKNKLVPSSTEFLRSHDKDFIALFFFGNPKDEAHFEHLLIPTYEVN